MVSDAASVPVAAGLRFERVVAGDAPEWFAFASLPEVKLHTSSTLTQLADLEAMIARGLAVDPASPIHFAIRAEGDRALRGVIGFHTVSPLNRTAEVTYELHPGHWGRGLATACCRAVTAWGFAARGFVRIQGTALQTNLASQRVLEKSGYAPEGTLRAFRIVRGEARDYRLYAAIARDWQA